MRILAKQASWRTALTSARRSHVIIASSSSTQNNTKNSQIAVIAFGGNALLKRGQPLTMENQLKNAQAAASSISQLINATHDQLNLCITHGNGPQVGLLAQQQTDPLDVLDAESEGQIGYMLEMALENEIPNKDVATILTQIVVDLDDPAFQHPTKPIGRWFTKEEADILKSKDKNISMAQDGDKWRRVVASPSPQRIIESKAINTLLREAGHIVICCGGGGIPVAEDSKTKRRFGVEAVIDKDAASALLAVELGAQYLIMLTDADAVYNPDGWPEKKEPLMSPITVAEIERMKGLFASGSMKPKIEAAVWYAQKMGGRGVAMIGSIHDLVDIFQGKKGTTITL